ncbi:3-deoxy-D-manno-octulosonate 8-phosphate phosphatase (KDO 8-P phosphatase) [Silvibacterium bohemicum]|uniref:3-deoxy-D-manno-octulosonate 8-phosphate phosphatase (KDO 8-P phosphatase) n=1 Tax=Silvibacterium bohemicum TaxID=1577686 RepID=A0A841JWB6_9BACT|nr:HAD hydrolase family protein [Silvibacterium bohemicum]MBB6145672.1 3-deoxy-D-manno-octulosonate 8-phosphate phosphatase (KDO 8-P phosphatase) [Silvibacterium bohemicum]
MAHKNASPEIQDRLRRIKAIAFDVDGVLTDGGMWWGADGEEFKRFSFSDIMGISLARRHGFTLTLISGEASPLVDRYAAKMKIADVTKGCRDKASALREFAGRNNLDLAEICFMGDDVNDLPAMGICGFSAAPADARPAVLEKVDFAATSPGGRGAVRELIEALFAAHETDSATVFANSI